MGFLRKLFRRGQAAPETSAVSEPLPPTAPLEAAPEVAAEPVVADAAPSIDRGATGLFTAPFDGTHQLQARQPALAVLQSSRPFAIWSGRDIGRVRRSNQDHVASTLMTLPDGDQDIAFALAVVADGMGGHMGGEIASQRAVESVMIAVLEHVALPALANEDPGTAIPVLLTSAIQDANARIWEEAQAQGTDMGTTCTAALILENHVYLAHVGDSRAYILADGRLRQITADHSTVGRLIAMGQLTDAESREHPLRNQLYRTVGQQPALDVDSLELELAGVSHLILCSDGLWGMVDDDELAAILLESPLPEDAGRRLIARANLAGGDDNISVVVVSLPALQQGGPNVE